MGNERPNLPVPWFQWRRISVNLQTGNPQTGHAMGLDSPLPGEKFFLGELVTAACFLETDRTAAHRSNDRSLPPRDPAFCARRRQFGKSLGSGQHSSPPVQQSLSQSVVEAVVSKNSSGRAVAEPEVASGRRG